MKLTAAHGSGMLGAMTRRMAERSAVLRGRNPDLPCCPKCAGCRLAPSTGEVADVWTVLNTDGLIVTPETAVAFAASADLAKGRRIRYGRANGRPVYWRDGEFVDPVSKLQPINPSEPCPCR